MPINHSFKICGGSRIFSKRNFFIVSKQKKSLVGVPNFFFRMITTRIFREKLNKKNFLMNFFKKLFIENEFLINFEYLIASFIHQNTKLCYVCF